MKFSLTVTCDMEEPPEFRVQQKKVSKNFCRPMSLIKINAPGGFHA